MFYIIKMFGRFFSKSKTHKTHEQKVFTEDYRKGYNKAWTNNIKNYWP
jgi:hypothetical protein